MEYIILGNTIEIFFNKRMDNQRFIHPDFDYSSRVFVSTDGITDILHYKTDEELRVYQQIIFNDIITKMKDASKTEKLDFLQLLKINGHTCMFIDNGNHISLIGSE